MNAAILKQLEAALKIRESQDGEAFTYQAVNAIGVPGVPTLEAQMIATGAQEKIDSTLTVRRSWFTNPPEARVGLLEFTISGRRFLVTAINADDPLAYEFTLLDRN